jgi:hypothetical protein
MSTGRVRLVSTSGERSDEEPLLEEPRMKSARSVLKFVFCGIATLVVASHCTVKAKSDTCDRDSFKTCTCSGDRTGTKACNEDGDGYLACVCDAPSNTGGSANTGGAASTGGSTTTGGVSSTGGASTSTGGAPQGTGGAGSSTGGASQSTGGAVTAGGAGGAGGSGGDDEQGYAGATGDACLDCLADKCTDELDACVADTQCFSEEVDGSGQFEQISNCVESQRAAGAVKRNALRTCGIEVGSSSGWPPDGMTEATLNLVNCLATGQSGIPNNNSWADADNLSMKWAASSCAALACTSGI